MPYCLRDIFIYIRDTPATKPDNGLSVCGRSLSKMGLMGRAEPENFYRKQAEPGLKGSGWAWPKNFGPCRALIN